MRKKDRTLWDLYENKFDGKVYFPYGQGGVLEKKIDDAVKKVECLESMNTDINSISTPRLIYLFKKAEKEFLKKIAEYTDVMPELLYDTPAHSVKSNTHNLKFLSNRVAHFEIAKIKNNHFNTLQRQQELREKIIEQLKEERKKPVLQNTPITDTPSTRQDQDSASPGLSRMTGSIEGLSAVTRDIIPTPTLFGSPVAHHASDDMLRSATPAFPFNQA